MWPFPPRAGRLRRPPQRSLPRITPDMPQLSSPFPAQNCATMPAQNCASMPARNCATLRAHEKNATSGVCMLTICLPGTKGHFHAVALWIGLFQYPVLDVYYVPSDVWCQMSIICARCPRNVKNMLMMMMMKIKKPDLKINKCPLLNKVDWYNKMVGLCTSLIKVTIVLTD